MKKIILVGMIALVFAGCEKNQAPTCSITSPQNGEEFLTSHDIPITVVAEDADGKIAKVQLYVDDIEYGSKTAYPYNFIIEEKSLHGTYTAKIKAVAIDNKGATAEASIKIRSVGTAHGEYYQGGIIVYFDYTGKHGLIVAPHDQSYGIQWSNGSYITTGATGRAVGTGQSNTAAIVAAQGNGNYAARICYDLVLNGYDDWFLPSKDELHRINELRYCVDGFEDSYWSSSEDSDNSAWYERSSQSSSRQDYDLKSNTKKVRAIRYF